MKKKKKKSQVVEPEFRLYISYSESSTGGDACSSDRWNYEPEYKEVEFHSVYRDGDSGPFFKDSACVSEETYNSPQVFLVVARYRTGDTFGTRYGEWEIVDVLSSRDAAVELAESIQNDTYKGYAPWKGHFERLSGVELHEFDVDASCSGGTLDNSSVKYVRH